ncbi:hypothetical protein E4T56_gene17755 [Termitomyces sp. T112]|nr:hypothetical protein E4T56_gene17755 [Termitomyces sp. T112]
MSQIIRCVTCVTIQPSCRDFLPANQKTTPPPSAPRAPVNQEHVTTKLFVSGTLALVVLAYRCLHLFFLWPNGFPEPESICNLQ